MALIPDNEKHRLQIAAGTIGRTRGHDFEKELAKSIAETRWTSTDFINRQKSHRAIGNPAIEIIRYMALSLGLTHIDSIKAWWLGGLATSGLGDVLHLPDGSKLSRSKTDVLVALSCDGVEHIKGLSVKTCSKDKPTNDQLYFTTASAFVSLLRGNDVPISNDAEVALKMFCGDAGFRPKDGHNITQRKSDPDRWFYEELPAKGREDLEAIIRERQSDITRLLLQLAYPNDPHPPEFLLHITRRAVDINASDLALFSIDELIALSFRYGGLVLKPYRVRKGRFKDDPNTHYAPRFGYVQFQRGGQKQHPTQLQFNLQAGYFDRLPG